ncbi:MAG: spermine/spermidine synthase domain-containing protein [Limisphaerales bacterium]
MKLPARTVFAAVMVCLFLSGMAGLMYEVVWARYLALFLGHTSYAVVAVLVAFMGGLALGNVVFGAVADRSTRPLALYAWLEIGIGAFALVFPAYYEACESFFLWLAKAWPGAGFMSFGVKFSFGLATILLPTVFMGGTLPLLARLLTRSLSEVRGNVAALYFVNSAGAVAGAWLADFILIEAIGIEATMLAGACLNLAVGVAALLINNWMLQAEMLAPPAAVPETAVAPAPVEVFSPGELRLAVLGIGLSGFVAMLYQVAWTRLLALALGSSTHAFSLMLITFIAGITVGSLIVYRWKTLRDTLGAFAWTELALAGAIAGSMFFYEFLPYWFPKLAEMLARREEVYPLYSLLQGAICFAVMFVPTVCLGMTLPLASRVATAEVGRTGRSVGRIFAVNTVGTVLGAAVTGMWLLPTIGLARTFALGVALNAFIGLAILMQRRGAWRPGRWLAAPVVAAVFVVVVGAFFNRTWPGAFTMGLWRMMELPVSAGEFLDIARSPRLLYYRDGAGSTVSVHRTPEDAVTNLVMKVNGKAEASTMGDMNTQLMVGHLPMLLHPQPSDVLLVGLGSGITGGAVIVHPQLERLDIVEISPEVIGGARLFSEHNQRVVDDPRVTITIDDAKSFLRVTDRTYQVIISEPSNPWMAGVAGVFSLEFYQDCRKRLAPGGLMVQWVQLYEFSDAALDTVLATFTSEFPHVSVWQSHRADLMLVGSVEPRKDDLDRVIARLNEPAVMADLARADMANVPLVLAHEIITPDLTRFMPPPEVRLHSDYYPTLEYLAQRDFFARPRVTRYRQVDETFSVRADTLLARYLRQHRLTADDYQAFARYYLADHQPYMDLFATMLLRWETEEPGRVEPWEMASRFKFLSAPGELEVLRLEPIRALIEERAAVNPTLLRQYGLARARQYLDQRSVFHLPEQDEIIEILLSLTHADPANQRTYQAFLAELAWDRGDDAACIQYAEQALAPDTERGPARFKLDANLPVRAAARMADSLARLGRLPRAVAFCEEFAKSGFLTPETREDGLMFEVTQRRLQSLLNDLTAVQLQLRPPPGTAP